jgi:DNA invertase Pin-like site-specific DNA recombinase
MTKSGKTVDHAKRRVALYVRRAAKEKPGYDEASRVEGERFCLRQFGEMPLVFDDTGCSGMSLDRAELRALMERTAAGKIKAVVVRDMWALSRNFIDLVWITETFGFFDVEVHSMGEVLEKAGRKKWSESCVR